MAAPPVRLFVYGSLKRGGRHHAELQNSRFLGEATTAPGHAVIQLGDYPALIQADDGVVTGELFEVPESLLPALDELEGDAYVRQNLAVRVAGATDLALALAYFHNAR
ncbi:MAG TPA: gamma-glutamylcyclotransferase family protein [Polyangiaceae bacterium]|nr:gamma-glutamylcyclotransferase family protein [Polyangiaceae bacterium]